MAFLQEYEKIQKIGEGSFADIYKVRHEKLGYIRAVKMLHKSVSDENDPAYKTFLNECKILLRIGNGSHPNIVRIYQPRLIDNRAIVEMDYVEGDTLNEYIKRKKFLTLKEFYHLFEDIVGALAYCHHDIYRFLMNPNEDDLQTDPNDGRQYIIDEDTERRLVKKYCVTHNDIHSNNIMRRSYDGHFILLDFGLAIQDGKAVKSSSRRGGALEYMSPEKLDDNAIVTTQSDVYSLGILLYEALAGRVPFVLDPERFSKNPIVAQYEIRNQHLNEQPPAIAPLRREAFEAANPGQTYVKDYPDWLEDMIMKCLAKNSADRYADAKEMLDDFNAHIKEENDNVPSAFELESRHDALNNDDVHRTHDFEHYQYTYCPNCGKMISSDALFCQYCGSHLHSSDGNEQVKCNGCGNLISSDAEECPYCGYPHGTMVLCHGCGNWVSARLANCPHCGYHFGGTSENCDEGVPETTPDEASKPEQESDQEYFQTPDTTTTIGKNKAKKWWLWGALFGILSLLVIALTTDYYNLGGIWWLVVLIAIGISVAITIGSNVQKIKSEKKKRIIFVTGLYVAAFAIFLPSIDGFDGFYCRVSLPSLILFFSMMVIIIFILSRRNKHTKQFNT